MSPSSAEGLAQINALSASSRYPDLKLAPDQSVATHSPRAIESPTTPGSRLSGDSIVRHPDEKSTVDFDVQSIPSYTDNSPQDRKRETCRWRPSLYRIAPLAGIAALTFVVLQVVAAYAVLAGSDGHEVSSWTYEPNVYLAILTAMSNKAVAFAVVQGTVVTFWLHALKGTTLSQLHRDWSYGLHVYKAIFSGKNFSLLALACICSTLVIVDGPLLQRSSTVKSRTPSERVPLNVDIVPELPAYNGGAAQLDNPNPTTWVYAHIDNIIKDFAVGRPMTAVRGCVGRCKATIRAPALAVDSCWSTMEFVNFSAPLSASVREINSISYLPPPDRVVFDTSYGVYTGLSEQLHFRTRIAQSPGNSTCAAFVNTTTCALVSATAEYDITIVDGVTNYEVQPYPKIVARAGNAALTNASIAKYNLTTNVPYLTRSTLAGLVWAAKLKYQAVITLYPLGHGGAMSEGHSIGNLFTSWNMFGFEHTILDGNPNHCVPSFADPRDSVMAGLNDIMFRSGAYWSDHWGGVEPPLLLDPGVKIKNNVTGQTDNQLTVFETDFRFFAAAASLQLFTVCVITFTFWGWWRLGREVSLSPLETAKAMDAPLLRDVSSNLNGRHIAKLKGFGQVRYGVPRGESAGSSWSQDDVQTLIIADADKIDTPVSKRLGAWELCNDLRRAVVDRKSKRKSGETGARATQNSV